MGDLLLVSNEASGVSLRELDMQDLRSQTSPLAEHEEGSAILETIHGGLAV